MRLADPGSTCEKSLMNFFKGSRGVLGLLVLAGCVAAPVPGDLAKRSADELDRRIAARSYSDFLQGRYASLTNDPERAADAYRGAFKDNPYNADLLERAVFSALISGDVDGAIEIARRAPDQTVAEVDLTRLTLGVADLADGTRPGRVINQLQAPSVSQFNDLVSRGVQAWAAYERDGLAAAELTLSQSESRDPLIQGLTLANLALIQIHHGADDAALDLLDRIWTDGVRLAVATEHQARLLHARGQTDDAIRLLTKFGLRVGQNAAIEKLREDLESGAPVVLERPSLQQGAALAIYMPAAALASHTGDDLAGVYFALSLHLDPDLHVARTLWGDALDKAHRRDAALALLESVPPSSVFYATSRGQLAWALRREGLNDEALQTAEAALAAAPDRNLKIQLGDLFRSLEQYSDAERIFGEIIEDDETRGISDWRLLYARGAARQELGRWPDAEADLLTAMKLAPEEPSLLNYLGYSWIDRGLHLEEGFQMIQRAVDLRPNAGFIVDSLGWAYYRLGQYDEAVKHLERAVELAPGEAVLNDHLGDAYWRVGRKLEAGYQWNRALRLDPDSEDSALLHAKLETGLDAAIAHIATNNALSEPAASP